MVIYLSPQERTLCTALSTGYHTWTCSLEGKKYIMNDVHSKKTIYTFIKQRFFPMHILHDCIHLCSNVSNKSAEMYHRHHFYMQMCRFEKYFHGWRAINYQHESDIEMNMVLKKRRGVGGTVKPWIVSKNCPQTHFVEITKCCYTGCCHHPLL